MVAYLLIIFGLSIVASGLCYNITSDVVDLMINSVSQAYLTNPEFTMDSDSIAGGDIVLAIFKFCLIPILFCLMFWAWNYSQKPMKSW